MAKAFDFTTGSIPKKMVLFSIPLLLTNVLQTSYQFIDSLWVGNLLGAQALAAVALAGPVIFTVLSLMIGINGATLTVLSQHRGAGDEDGLKESLNAFAFVLGILSVALGIAGYVLAGPLLHFLGAPDNVHPLALTYLRLNFVGIPFLFGYNFVSTVLRALGDSKTPIRFVALAVLLNSVLDPVLIAGFRLDIVGAALATVLAQGLAFGYGLSYSIQKAGVPYTVPHLPQWRYLKVLFRLGIPSGLQMTVISGGNMAIVGVVARFGEDVLAGFGAAERIGSLIMIAPMALGSAVTSMAGQNIGADKWKRVADVAKNGVGLILGVSVAISTFVFFVSGILIHLFVDDEATVSFGADYLKAVAFFYPFLGINFVLNGVVRASGAMFQVLALNFISFWVLRFPLVTLFSGWLGPDGIAIGIGVSFVMSSIVATLYYFFGKWRDVKIFDEEEPSQL
ncbi:MATE family efflux transporter [Novibacillus thermophilus]|uniref:MATE family efflux transporter n=1 Tax=Novibacillus thermophilus TaxID=1471761 RepID=A0A1U9K5B4_9BACL|nr:MATE family efflux transporter [Novibacillus thermophilus]AQS55235.1 MATE family efflux transporter [Novibacillus thermophilus]